MSVTAGGEHHLQGKTFVFSHRGGVDEGPPPKIAVFVMNKGRETGSIHLL